MSALNDRIYLSPPHMSGQEKELIEEAFHSNWITPLGPHVNAFEKELAEYIGINGAVALSSGTAAIHLALKLAGVGRGDTVFCSTLTFAASANPIVYQGAEPVFIDSEPESWNMSPQALWSAFQVANKECRLPKAVIIVNLYGQSADMDSLLEICDNYGVPVIEDAAESLGASYKGRASGTFGKFGIFSFNGNKIITTSGGGALVSDDVEALEKARFWATQSRDPARHYQHSQIGYNYRLSNLLAGVGRAQLKVLEDRVIARRGIFERYYNALQDYEGITFMPEPSYSQATRWLTALTIDSGLYGITANDIIDALANNNIEARPVWKPLHLQPVFRNCKYYPYESSLSVSEYLFNTGLCLPSGSSLSEQEQVRIIELIQDILRAVSLTGSRAVNRRVPISSVVINY